MIRPQPTAHYSPDSGLPNRTLLTTNPHMEKCAVLRSALSNPTAHYSARHTTISGGGPETTGARSVDRRASRTMISAGFEKGSETNAGQEARRTARQPECHQTWPAQLATACDPPVGGGRSRTKEPRMGRDRASDRLCRDLRRHTGEGASRNLAEAVSRTGAGQNLPFLQIDVLRWVICNVEAVRKQSFTGLISFQSDTPSLKFGSIA
jgi:hypothetical protein